MTFQTIIFSGSKGLLLGVEDTGFVTIELRLMDLFFLLPLIFCPLLLIVLHQLCPLHQVGANNLQKKVRAKAGISRGVGGGYRGMES